MFLRFINFTQIALACLSAGVAGASPPTADDFAARPRISSIALSPSGNQFAALVSINGAQPDIALWDVDALDQPPKILPKGTDELMFIGLSYLKEDRLWLSVLQHHLPRYSNGRYPAFIIDTKTQHFQPFYWQIIKQIREKNVVIVNNGQHISRLNLEKSGENYIFENIFLKSQSYFNYKLSFEGKQILSRQQLNYDIKGPIYQ